jgi:hypothetical protein
MTLVKGMLLSFANAKPGKPPDVLTFQYNPTEVTRVLTPATREVPKTPPTPGEHKNVPFVPTEDVSLKLEFDASEGLGKSGPISTTAGIAPQLAALESLLYPSEAAGLFGLVSQLLPGGGSAVPPATLPFVVFVWGPGRATPVKIKSLTIRETEFDSSLNPIQATADIGLTVLRAEDFEDGESLGKFAAGAYRAMRLAKAAAATPQLLELQ